MSVVNQAARLCDDQAAELINSSPLFNAEWYLSEYPDVAIAGMDPAIHYIKFGHRFDRNPAPRSFSTLYKYAYLYPDRLSYNPIVEYLKERPGEKRWRFNKKHALYAAFNMFNSGKPLRAIQLAQEHLPAEMRGAINILQANYALLQNNTALYLYYLNTYLRSTDSPTVTLLNPDVVRSPLLSNIKGTDIPRRVTGPLVSVIMPAFNAESTILWSARSILNQTWSNIELIIIDDCSTDRTYEMAQELARDPRVKLLRNKTNVGPYISKNVGVLAATGDFLTGQDADDWAHPERIKIQATYLIKTKAAACLSGMLRMTPTGRVSSLGKPGPNSLDGACRSAFISLMVSTPFFRNTLGFWDSVRFAGDSELVKRLELVTGRDIPRLHRVTMLCLDHPSSLTNDPTAGYSADQGLSAPRELYKRSFTKWHETLAPGLAALPIKHSPRIFEAPPETINPGSEASATLDTYAENPLTRPFRIDADVAIVTNCAYPGGNASSTLEEISHFQLRGLNVCVIHCPPDNYVMRNVDARYEEIIGRPIPYANQILEMRADLAIVRHPQVIVSRSFKQLMSKSSWGKVLFVINNSAFRYDGSPVYDVNSLFQTIDLCAAPKKHVLPISSHIREELCSHTGFSHVGVSPINWNPTFAVDKYYTAPKGRLSSPLVLGRHGRDGKEKWLEDAQELLMAYPDHSDFQVHILGGADVPIKTLGYRPENWEIFPFTLGSTKEFLASLDVFVYFPSKQLVEGFGRTIVEAMIAGRPCILAKQFENMFGDLAFCCEPQAAQNIARRLTENDQHRIRYLEEVQQVALDRYSTSTLGRKLDALNGSIAAAGGKEALSEASLSYKARVMKAT